MEINNAVVLAVFLVMTAAATIAHAEFEHSSFTWWAEPNCGATTASALTWSNQNGICECWILEESVAGYAVDYQGLTVDVFDEPSCSGDPIQEFTVSVGIMCLPVSWKAVQIRGCNSTPKVTKVSTLRNSRKSRDKVVVLCPADGITVLKLGGLR